MSKLHGHNGKGQGSNIRPSVAALPQSSFAEIRGMSPVCAHAREIMAQLIPLRHGYTPESIAQEAFSFARAFAAEEAKDEAKSPAEKDQPST